MKVCFILIGPSGAGKTTLIQSMKDKWFKEARVEVSSLDSERLRFYRTHRPTEVAGSEIEEYAAAHAFARDHSKKFDAHVTREWRRALRAEVLFVDNTNLTRKSRARWTREARHAGFTIWGVTLFTPLSTLLQRQESRADKRVPSDVVTDMFYRQQSVLVGSEVDFSLDVDCTLSQPALVGNIHLC